jgi:hypothetical protein
MMVQMLRTCQSSQTSYLRPPRKYLPLVVRTIGDPLFDDVGSRVDDQLQLGVSTSGSISHYTLVFLHSLHVNAPKKG